MNFKKSIIAAAAVVAMGAASFAQAAPTFTVNSASLIGAAGTTFQAQSIAATSSELLHRSADGTKDVGDGYIKYTSFEYAAQTDTEFGYTTAISGYNLYVKFHIEDLVGVGPNGSNVLTVLNFTMYADPQNDTLFRSAATSSTGGGREVAFQGDGNDIALASGSLINGIASINALGGAALNANTTFELTAAGKLFFVAPTPFFNLSFNGFNNPTGAAVTNNDGTIAINAGGTTEFNVPEPTSIALLGLGLLAVGATARRKS